MKDQLPYAFCIQKAHQLVSSDAVGTLFKSLLVDFV